MAAMIMGPRLPHGAWRVSVARRAQVLTSRAFAKEEKKVPPETPEEVTRKLREQRDYWDKQERSTVKVILSQWGGLLFFGFWCGIAWLGKTWGEYEMAIIEREMAEPRRYRRRSDE
eukprot:symbB.v1.2.038144.t1/scaffold5837.1/size23234/3